MKTINSKALNISFYADMTGLCANAKEADAFGTRLHDLAVGFLAEVQGKTVDAMEDELAADIGDARARFVSIIELGSEAVLNSVLGI